MPAPSASQPAEILVVDDQELMRLSLEEALSRVGRAVTTAAGGEAALQLVDGHAYEVVITDLKMPGMDGLELTRRLTERCPDTPVVVITAHGSIETAVEAMRRGAFDYVQKPFEADEIEMVVCRALAHRRLRLENAGLKRHLDAAAQALVGSSRVVADLREEIAQVAPSRATVLVSGETGSGKELVAQAIHAAGPRREQMFLCVNCAALSAGLLESELFGHERGAFTGADRMRLGRFELADGGTLLLDEVSEIDLGLQAKLLRVLQEGRFERVGSSASRRADVRVIATTNRDLAEAVRAGRFRRDLYFRLAVLPIRVPPLREHPQDIGDLVAHFLQRHGAEARRPRQAGEVPLSVHPETIRLLQRYHWPGNVRELENLIRRALVMDFGPQVRPEHIQGWLACPESGPAGAPTAHRTLAETEQSVVTAALVRHGGNRTRAAADLGISPRTLRDKLARWRAQGLTVAGASQARKSA